MSEYFIRRMEAAELKDFYRRIQQDFTSGEYAPYSALHHQLTRGIQEGLVFCEDGKDRAYSICAIGNDNRYVLISLFAVFEEYRGQGIGSAFLKVLCKRYEHKQAVIVEVERPELSQNPGEINLCRRRINFYEKAGFYLIPGIDYTIWDVPMYLMALPVMAPMKTINKKIGRIMYETYFKLLGERFIHKMEIKVLGGNLTLNPGEENDSLQ